ncbi:aldehyde oxidase GLOX1 isoform X1 [Gossypium raimondii]|uniref:aldehyde oxidase GLOX1 isoform X1 n=1 Tax=Gossypium raimondii TaxID=29730 RepID=UPI00063AF038|nr:aldehyde oxidase GLOX1 isoform X1 [Gossypium raimondii]
MALFWRGLIILPLLFVYASSHFIYTKRHFDKPEVVGFKDLDYLHGDGGGFLSGPIEADDGVKASKTVVEAESDDDDNDDDDGDKKSKKKKEKKNQKNKKEKKKSKKDKKYDESFHTLPVESLVNEKGGDGNTDDSSQLVGYNVVTAQTTFKGSWELFVENSGVSAMHVVLLPNINQALIFDATVWKVSKLKLPGPPCRHVEGTNEEDCFAHSILLDVETAHIRPLRLNYDTWCSSGALDINGRLVSTGGYNNGSDTVRILDLCDTCGWEEYPGALGNGRWYATQVTLGDGRFMVFGGRDFPTYEFVPPQGQKNTLKDVIDFNFLVETHDPVENNLYPFVYLSTDGNVFIFANNRSVLLNPNTQTIIHEFPVLPNGARNYPASGSACLLPIMLKPNEDRRVIPSEVLICGGASHDAYTKADLQRPKVFLPGNTDCARLDITKRNGKWKIINMPSARLLGDMVVLPTGDVLIVNGAKTGSAGWDDAREPNLNPVLYKFQTDGTGSKFTVLNPSNIPRMYHSSFALLPDAKILIAGSNTNPGYLDDALFPTEVRVEKFSPHYLDPNLAMFRQEIIVEKSNNQVKYGQKFTVQIRGNGEIDQQKLQVTVYSPPFVTHGISMNQRLIQLGIMEFNKNVAPNTNNIVLQAPMNGNIAPPGYYMLFVNYNGVPCRQSMWVQFLP